MLAVMCVAVALAIACVFKIKSFDKHNDWSFWSVEAVLWGIASVCAIASALPNLTNEHWPWALFLLGLGALCFIACAICACAAVGDRLLVAVKEAWRKFWHADVSNLNVTDNSADVIMPGPGPDGDWQ